MKYLVSSYTRLIWVVYSGEVGVEVGTRYRTCHRGWVVSVHGGDSAIIQGVPGGKDLTSGECSLGQTIPI